MKRFVSESRPFQIRSTVEIPGRASLREERTAELFQIEIGIPNWFRRWTFHALNSMYEVRLRVRLMKSLASEPGLSQWLNPRHYILRCSLIFKVLIWNLALDRQKNGIVTSLGDEGLSSFFSYILHRN